MIAATSAPHVSGAERWSVGDLGGFLRRAEWACRPDHLIGQHAHPDAAYSSRFSTFSARGPFGSFTRSKLTR